MTPNVTIIDYGMGNLLSICRAFEKVGANVIIANSPEDILAAERLVLPGVGAFPDGMIELNNRGFVTAIHEYVKKGNFLLGICLGMQMLFDESKEIQRTTGLGLIPGKILKLPLSQSNGHTNKIPHVAWAQIKGENEKKWQNSIFTNIEQNTYMYFVHSFFALPLSPKDMLSITQFGDILFCSAVVKSNVIGTQFHPEKSGLAGMAILKNFLYF